MLEQDKKKISNTFQIKAWTLNVVVMEVVCIHSFKDKLHDNGYGDNTT